ncbi:MAG TPA: hypothetical protein VLL47_01685, partial [Robiginitalea sp.]|nr:hypothetical protein [Robiginitalea sp.]
MTFSRWAYASGILLMGILGCGQQSKENRRNTPEESTDIIQEPPADSLPEAAGEAEPEKFVLSEDNAIDFFFGYQQG